jgi:hypothetical protein
MIWFLPVFLFWALTLRPLVHHLRPFAFHEHAFRLRWPTCLAQVNDNKPMISSVGFDRNLDFRQVQSLRLSSTEDLGIYCSGRSARWEIPRRFCGLESRRGTPDDHGRTSVGRPPGGSNSVQIRFNGLGPERRKPCGVHRKENPPEHEGRVSGTLMGRTGGRASFSFRAIRLICRA